MENSFFRFFFWVSKSVIHHRMNSRYQLLEMKNWDPWFFSSFPPSIGLFWWSWLDLLLRADPIRHLASLDSHRCSSQLMNLPLPSVRSDFFPTWVQLGTNRCHSSAVAHLPFTSSLNNLLNTFLSKKARVDQVIYSDLKVKDLTNSSVPRSELPLTFSFHLPRVEGGVNNER